MQVSNRPLPNGTMWWCERGWKIVRNNYFPTLLDFTFNQLLCNNKNTCKCKKGKI